MKKATGLRDFKGNRYVIQAAGSVYNKDKNSFAIGKGTVGKGSDQFVFGCYNEEDTRSEYVEVVGGGSGETISVDVVRAMSKTDANGNHDFTPCAQDISSPMSFEMQKLKVSDSTKTRLGAKDVYVVTAVGQHNTLPYYNDPRYLLGVKVGNMVVERVFTSGTEYSIEEWSITETGDLVGTASSPVEGVQYGSYSVTPIGASSSTERKNLRTMDWGGTVWTKGDVTCDDGHGNTISLREVASRQCNCSGEGGSNIDESSLNAKADKVEDAEAGNFAGLDQNGNLTDTGYKPSDFALASALSGKMDNSNITVDLSVSDGAVREYYQDDEFTALFAQERLGKCYIAKVFFTHFSGINVPYICLGHTRATESDGKLYAYLTFGQKTLVFAKTVSTGVVTIETSTVAF